MEPVVLKHSDKSREIVDQYLYLKSEKTKEQISIVPGGFPRLIIKFEIIPYHKEYSLSVFFTWCNNHNYIKKYKLKESKINSFSSETMICFLKPGGFYKLFGFDLKILSTKLNFIKSFFESYLNETITRIRSEQCPHKKTNHINSFLIRKPNLYTIDDRILHFVNFIKKNKYEKIMINNYVSNIDISYSTFIRNFYKVYGVSPKQMITIEMVNSSLKYIASNPDKELINAALHSGFYDQAHFIRSFKKFTGILPKKYKELVISGNTSAHFPNLLFQQNN